MITQNPPRKLAPDSERNNYIVDVDAEREQVVARTYGKDGGETRDEIVHRYNAHENLQETIAARESEKHVLEAALYEVAKIVADSDLDATTQLAQLSMALSGIEQAGLIDGDKVGTDEQPTVDPDTL